MKFKRYYGYIHTVVFSAGFVSVVSWGLLILILLGDQPVDVTEKENILFLLIFVLGPFFCSGTMLFYIQSGVQEDGGHFKDEIEMNSEGIRLHGRKTGDVFLAWENVVELLIIRRMHTPFEIVVRGTNAEINFFGNYKARRYIKRRIGLKIKKAPSNWRERTDWRKKYDADKM